MASIFGLVRGPFLLLLLATCIQLIPRVEAADFPLRIISWNLRYSNVSDASRRKNEKLVAIRKPRIFSQLNFLTSGGKVADHTLLCIQEAANINHLRDLQAGLGKEWVFIGEGTSGGTKGAFSPIFYRPSAWTLLRNQTLWLGPTPKVPSNGFNSSHPRNLVASLFQHKESKQEVVLLCSHFDHKSYPGREKSATLARKIGDEWAAGGTGTSGSFKNITADKKGEKAVFLAGDMNFRPTDEAYRVMTTKDGANGTAMRDSRDMAPVAVRHGNNGTAPGFRNNNKPNVPPRIDFVFVRDSPQGKGAPKVSVDSYAVLSNWFEDDPVFSTDHRPVILDFTLSS